MFDETISVRAGGGAQTVATRGRVRTEASHKRVRVFLGGVCIVDSRDALYVWEGPRYPQYYLPRRDFADGVLERSTTTVRSPSRGTAGHFTVRAGGREAVDAAWLYEDSPLPELRGRIRLDWEAMDGWFEEDEEVFVHPRTRRTRVQILPARATSSSPSTVSSSPSRAGRPSCTRPACRVRTYIPKLDVRMDRMEPTDTASQCPYKGTATYWTVRTDEARHPDLAWSYPAPRRESAPIAGTHRLLRRSSRAHGRRRSAVASPHTFRRTTSLDCCNESRGEAQQPPAPGRSS